MRKTASLLIVSLMLGACSLAPDYSRPQLEMPAAWSGNAGQIQDMTGWWKNFDSDELNGLMTQALERNNELRASLHRVEQARADLQIAGAPLLPSADGSGALSWTRTDPPSGKTTSEKAGRAAAGLSYELDLFGANFNAAAAASESYRGAQFESDALALIIMGEVANGYFTLLNIRERLAIAHGNLKNTRDILRLVQARYDAGAVSAVDLAQQKAAVANNEASLASLGQQETVALDALAVLAGVTPQALTIKGYNVKKLTVPAIAPGQPSELLVRRPDIESAEAALKAANANIGVARAAFFPSITLGLDGSLAASPLSDPATEALSLAGALAVPLFEGGRLEGGVEKATARQAELAENYRKTMLVSFQEVEDAMAAVKAAQSREQALKTVVRESQRAYDLSHTQYKAGAIDFQTLLNTQQSLFSAQDNEAQARLAMLTSAVNLYKALGGGWQRPEKQKP